MTSFKNDFMNNGFMLEAHQLFYHPDKFLQTIEYENSIFAFFKLIGEKKEKCVKLF